ncbi:30S ribosomal protein S2 [Patescibacteria group bacterium]|nr:30S ribosomal protein S2 [Patescibacteria group bacterium]
MAEEAKKTVKVVDRRENKPKKASLVLKAKKQSKVDAEKIRKLNEKTAAAKKAAEESRQLAEAPEQEVQVSTPTSEVSVREMEVGHKYELSIDLKDLLAAGCHLGHKTSKTNPHFRDFIYTTKDGIEIIDLIKTREMLERTCNYIYGLVRSGRKLVMVGTKRQAREVVRRVAMEAGVPYITDRWLGGTISNWEQISKNIKKLAEIKEGLEKGRYADYTKKELSLLKKEMARLEKIVGGLAGLDKLFDAILVVDSGFEKTALKEARGRKVVTIGVADTDSDPRAVDFLVPANDDSVKSVAAVIEEIGKAITAAKKEK